MFENIVNKISNKSTSLCVKLSKPIIENLWFFSFTLLISIFVYYFEFSLDWRAVAQYFFEIYLICLFLSSLPRKARKIVKLALYIVFYTLTLTDFACWLLVDSPISPTLFQLMMQTNSQEATEAIHSYVNADLFKHKTFDIVLAAMLLNIVLETRILIKKDLNQNAIPKAKQTQTKLTVLQTIGLATAIALPVSCYSCIYNLSDNIYRLLSTTNQGFNQSLFGLDEVKIGKPLGFFSPFWRTLRAAKVYSLNSSLIIDLEQLTEKIEVDNCSFLSKNIIIIIGESYNRHHCQLYGYDKPTSPLMQKIKLESSNLILFSDVVSSWPMTTESFQEMFSMHSYGDSCEWFQCPTFPMLMKMSGYRTIFVTNQFTKRLNTDFQDFRGGLFINSDKLSNAQFDKRNTKKAKFDADLIVQNDSLLDIDSNTANLFIIHLYGQHFNYGERFPKQFKTFTPQDYSSRTDLSTAQKQILADYDNATLYNDYVVQSVVEKYKSDDAIIIYVPDHGERVFDNCQECYRSQAMDANTIKQQFEIPFWIYCTDSYIETHPSIYKTLNLNKDKPYMTDNIAQLIIGLAGIQTKYYNPKNDISSTLYNGTRRRLLKGEYDYDLIIKR